MPPTNALVSMIALVQPPLNGCPLSRSESNPFNGTFTIHVLNEKSFTYITALNPGANADGTPSYGRIWHIDRYAIEQNIIDLRRSFGVENDILQAIGVITLGARFQPPYSNLFNIRDAIVRRNLIRYADGLANPDRFVRAIDATCGFIVAEENAIETPYEPNILHRTPQSSRYFNNRRPAGAIATPKTNAGTPEDDLASTPEDALALALGRTET